MRIRVKMLLVLALAVVLCGGLTFPAQALTTLDFTVPGSNPGASIFYDGLGGPLVGTGITITEVLGKNTPLHNGTLLPITGGVLNFTSGNLTSSALTPVPSWSFGSGGTITISGGIPGFTGTLMTGSFQSAIVLTVASSGTTGFEISGAQFTDVKNPQLLEYFGISPTSAFWGTFNIGFLAPLTIPPAGFQSLSVTSGDVLNNTVPLPPSVFLLGSGIVGLGLLGWRRRKES
jgi:hypothetical protein